jgi:hypothetical protein
MSVGKVDGANKYPSKEIARVEPQKPPPDAPEKPGSKIVEHTKKLADHKGKPSELKAFNPTDTVEVRDPDAEEQNQINAVKEEESKDSVEISVRDPELLERIKELIETIKEQKEKLSERIQEAQMLIMQRAYDNNEEVGKTAESILAGETVEDIDV